MADKKISALTAAATPLAGTEVLPIVQSGATVKVSVDNLTNGKTVTANKFYAPSTDATPIDIRRSVANNTVLANVADSPSLSNANYVLFGIDVSGGSVGYSSGGAFVSTGANGTGTARSLILHTYGNNDIVFARQNTAIASITANGFAPVAGKGIDFSANGGDVLSQYDEGTWTPVITGSSSNPTVTYGLQRGKYVRVGNVVTVSAFISWSAISGGSGDLRISLPFAGESSVGASGAGSISSMDGFTFAAGRTFCSFQPQANVLYGNLPQTGSGVSSSNTTIAQMASSGLIIFSCTYLI